MQALISEEQLVRHHITYPVIPKIYTVGNCLLPLFKNKAMYGFLGNIQCGLSMMSWSIHTLFNALKGYGLTKTKKVVDQARCH